MNTPSVKFIAGLIVVIGLGLSTRPASRLTTISTRFAEVQDTAGLRFQFRNSATPNKYLIETMGGGVAILDYDQDGWPDVFFVNGARLKSPQPDSEPPDKSAPEFWNRLFRNNRDGTFTDVTEKAGVKGIGYGMGVAVGDYDNDGYPDLFVTNFGKCILYHNNGDGTFSDVTDRSGIRTEGWNMSAGFLDYDNDGYLDLFVTRYLEWNFSAGAKTCGVNIPGGKAYCHPNEFRAISNYLFHNNGDGTFTDVSQPSRIGASKGYGLGSAFGDFNNDGLMDISVANDAFPQFLFKNNGDGTFTEMAAMAGVGYTEDGNTFSGMGTDFVDLDNDGWLDILTTALPYEYFALFHNNGDGTFAYTSVITNLAEISRPYGGWGIHVFDCDNDGKNELFVATSHVMDNIEVTQPHLHYLEKPLLLKYEENKFVDVSAEAGDGLGHPWAARGAAFGDLFNEGRIDIVISDYQGPAHLLRNEGENNYHWIELDLRGTKSNRDAIGARVKLVSESGKVQYRSVSPAGSYASANDRRIVFGLGDEDEIREIRIRWPSSTEQVIDRPTPDQILRVTEPPPSSGAARGRTAEAGSAFSWVPKGIRILPASYRAVQLGDNQVGKRDYESGLALLRQGKISEAAKAFRTALLLKPDDVDAHYALGVALSHMDREHFPEAVDQFLEVLRLKPDDVDARVDLSSILAREGDSAAATTQLEQAIRLAPTNPDLFILLGKARLDFNDYPQAIKSFEKASDLNPQLGAAHYGLGLAFARQHDNARAIQEFRRALELNPRDAFSYVELGEIYLNTADLKEAERNLREAVNLRPDLAKPHVGLGKVYQRENAPDKAEAAYRDALRLEPNLSDAAYNLGWLLRSQGKTVEAAEFLARGESHRKARVSMGTANAINADGIKDVEEGELPQALVAFDKALATDPSYFMAAYNRGVVLGRLGKKLEAIAAFRAAIRLRPDFALSHYGLGIMLKSEGDPGAADELAKAQSLNKYVAQPLGRDVLLPDMTK